MLPSISLDCRIKQIRELLRLPEPTQDELHELYEVHPWIQELDQLEREAEESRQHAQCTGQYRTAHYS